MKSIEAAGYKPGPRTFVLASMRPRPNSFKDGKTS